MRNLRSEKGNVLVLTAILLPVLLGMGALAVDAGYLFDYQRQLSGIADAAAAAAADDVQWYASATGANEGTVKAQATAAALASAQANDPTLTASNVVADCPPTSGSYAGTTCLGDGVVRVKITRSVPTFLMRVLGTNAITVSETATAGAVESDACVMALSTTAGASPYTGVTVSSGANPSLPKCRVVSNANATISGTGTLATQELDVTGTCGTCPGKVLPGPAKTGVPASNDPMQSWSDASLKNRFANCAAAPWSVGNNMPSLNSTINVPSGVYCSDGTHPALALLGSSNSFRYQLSGVYNIVDAGISTTRSLLEIGANTTVTGSDVTFYFMSDGSHTYLPCGGSGLAVNLAAVSSVNGTVSANTGGKGTYTVGNAAPGANSGTSSLYLAAPIAGTWSSLLFVHDRTQGNCGAGSTPVAASLQHANIYLDGMSYFPGQHVDVGGTQLAGAPPAYWGIIARNVTFTGGSLGNGGDNHHDHYGGEGDEHRHRRFHDEN